MVADQPDVRSKLKGVLTMGPGNIVGDVMHRRCTLYLVCLICREEHEAESYVVAITVSGLRERLSSVAVARVVDYVSVRPDMSDSKPARMIPNCRRNTVWQGLRKCLLVTNYICARE